MKDSILCFTYTDKLLHLALLHALLELALLVGVKSSQSVRMRRDQLLGVNPTVRECEVWIRRTLGPWLLLWWCASVLWLDGFIGREYGSSA